MIGDEIIGENITEQQYRDLELVSYSLLSSVDRDRHSALTQKVRETDAMKIGVLTESILFNDYCRSDYYIMPKAPVTNKLKDACDVIFPYLLEADKIESDLTKYSKQVTNFLSDTFIDYWAKKEPEWRASKICNDTDVQIYWQMFVKSAGKIVITQDMLDLSNLMADTLKNHEFTKHIFNTGKTFEDIRKYSQVKICFDYMGMTFKTMLDWLIINHTTKTISPYDLKTGRKNVEDFEETYSFWRYDIQAYLYTLALEALMSEHYPDYTLENFKFVYISKYNPYRPLVWENPPEMLTATGHGYYKDNKYFKSVKELTEDYLWYKEDEKRMYAKEIYDNSGVVKINTQNIRINGAN